jgi:hypothetical protein
VVASRVIKLVTQFDHADTRASAATPTCGGCCCCCCCIASLISTSAFTAMHLRVHARRLKQTTGTSPSPRPEIAGALALPSALVFTAIFAQSGSEGSTLVLGTTAWFLILLGLYRWVQAKRPWVPALVTVAIGGALLFGELVVALAVLADIGAYLFLALVFSIIAIVFEYALLLGRR